jgi:hypothetical protein
MRTCRRVRQAVRELPCLDDRFHETGRHGTGDSLVDSSFVSDRARSGLMARWRQAIELAMTDEEFDGLTAIARSRSESARRVERARMLLAYCESPSFYAVGQRLGAHHQTVQRCVERALAYGPLAALDDRPRPGKEPTITPEAKAWLCLWRARRPRSTFIRTSSGRSQAAQGAVLFGTSRRRVRAEDGGGSVRLSRGRAPEKGCQV